ncbi:uncharacterized protein AKAME5_002261900 [Lates japonicus]|uniref:Uncharacterized protein n=1 Tax=Lates japonicus TaxID=270547 RepID=A0AAD3RJC0_LATJO|nr:uncharacterized protein AKAME5_002261900 [Lates japonicus]
MKVESVCELMNQCEDREEGVPPSKTTLCGEHESQTKAQRRKLECSDWCVDYTMSFIDERHNVDQRIYGRPGSAESGPSCVSFKSDRSNDLYIDFKGRQPSAAKRLNQKTSEVASGQSAQQHQTHLDSIFKLLEENIVTFVKNELKKMQKRKPCWEYLQEELKKLKHRPSCSRSSLGLHSSPLPWSNFSKSFCHNTSTVNPSPFLWHLLKECLTLPELDSHDDEH